MAARAALLGSYFSSGICRRMLLLLTDTTSIQQAVQSKSESVLHPEALRETKNDAEHNTAVAIDASKSE